MPEGQEQDLGSQEEESRDSLASSFGDLVDQDSSSESDYSDSESQEVSDGEAPNEGLDRPDYLLEKFKSVEEQAKAYNAAQKILGRVSSIEKYLGAPEDGYNIPDELKDNDLVSEVANFCKESGFSQDFFDKATSFINRGEEIKALSKEELYKSIGDDAESRIKNVTNFVKNNFPPEVVAGLKHVPANADSLRFFEHVRDMITQTGVPTNMSYSNNKTDTLDQIRREMVENKEKLKDPEFARQMNERMLKAGAKRVEYPYSGQKR